MKAQPPTRERWDALCNNPIKAGTIWRKFKSGQIVKVLNGCDSQFDNKLRLLHEDGKETENQKRYFVNDYEWLF